MLFKMKSSDEPTHWTEIYVIVTISLMLIEDIRKVFPFYLQIKNSVFQKRFRWNI